MTLRRLQYFVAVAEELSFTAAARALHVAQPPLSTQVRELERELGAQLFHRDRRGVTLTAAGTAILAEARRLLERYDALGPLARRAAEGRVGRLAVGLVPSAANGGLPAVLRQHKEVLPDVEVSLVEGRPATLLRMLDAEQLDVVLQYFAPIGPEYAGRVLDHENLLLATPAEHPLAGRRRVPVRALGGEPLILPPRHGGEGLYEHVTRMLHRHGVTPRIVQEDVWMMQTVVGLVAAGMGLALVPESAAVIRASEVSYRPLTPRLDPVPLVAAWRAVDRSPTVERFVELWPHSRS